MGKWNKAPPEISEEFLQNQQRRKQMIIQAARRRKQKQKKLQQQVQQQKKQQQQALIKHKQQKKEAYIKYLRNNMHDKYQQMKHNQKRNQPQVRTKSKWKKQTLDSNSQLKPQSNLQGLDLDVNMQRRNNLVVNRISNKVGGQVVRNSPLKEKNVQKEGYSRNAPNTKKTEEKKENPKHSQKRRLLQDQFENMWNQDHQEQEKQIQYDLSLEQTVFDDLMGSKLLDSLDLDLDTVSRGKKLDKKIREQKKSQFQKQKLKDNANKQIDEIKQMIGYESVLVSIDQRSQMIKKYNELMKNEVEDPNKIQPQKKRPQQDFKKDKSRQKNSKNPSKEIKNQKQAKPLNQGQVFNELKNKKQGKILNWAQGEAEQADDLFSNCSTSKKSRTRGFQMLKQINKQIQTQNKRVPQPVQSTGNISNPSNSQANMRKKQKPLDIIPEKKINASLQRLRQRSYQKKNPVNQAQKPNLISNNQNRSSEIKRSASKQKIIEVSKPRPNRLNSAQIRSTQPPHPGRVLSKQKANKTTTNSFKQTNISGEIANQQRNRTDSRRSLSRQKQSHNKQSRQIIAQQQGYSRINSQKPQQPALQSGRQQQKKLPHLPPAYQKPQNQDTVTIATQQQVFQVQSFIKNELVALNQEQRQLQQDLKNIHIQNKDKLKQVQKKYDIRTDYKHSSELRQKEEGYQGEEDNATEKSYGQMHKKQSEDELQESIQRLDDMLLRRQIINKEKHSRITEEDNESQSNTQRSIINPMSDPITFHKQVLQLAQNLSRFQKDPNQIQEGYGAKLRMQKKSSVQKGKKPQGNKLQTQQSQKKQTQIDLSQSQDVNYSQLNSMQAKSKVSKVSKPPQLQYDQSNHGLPPGFNPSDLLDDELQDSIQKGKIQVNERLRKMLLE